MKHSDNTTSVRPGLVAFLIMTVLVLIAAIVLIKSLTTAEPVGPQGDGSSAVVTDTNMAVKTNSSPAPHDDVPVETVVALAQFGLQVTNPVRVATSVKARPPIVLPKSPVTQ